ncbi:M48 family metallopeptidase [Frederiksenia canicola]|uniref:Deoxyribonuclease HsdR n=1 Tax=Frederiksenia canicola TaxID=123824 RepID=A0AAE6X5K2_9PAST|nr:M48 family metallopeptidase [Frederiksenia canicola]QIM64256.1 deoxyribonuclease HsdR [Frederiksenia canicola]RPE93800.1 Zn-dependent protease with chaperone function [Frederiksenia canicola]
MKKAKKLAAITFVSLGIASCVNTASLNQEAAHSYAQLKQQASAQRAIDTNSPTAQKVHRVFQKMKPYAEKANKTGVPFQWEMIVLKDNELNAWAMPGGKMAFYTGLVERLKLSDDEIAVIVGHEMAHALQEHSKSDRTVSAITGIAGELGKIALATQGISTNVGGYDAVDMLTEFGLNKPFSRSQETEADEVGLFLMAESGYNPEAAPNVWVKMSQASGGSGLSIFSTHPSNEDRQKNLARLVPKAKEIYLNNKK